jgi:diguanylate cyclase (GGDEF)-like protein
MKKFLKTVKIDLPTEYKDDFFNELNKENQLKLLITSILLIISESIIYYFFRFDISDSSPIVLKFLIFNTFSFPILLIFYLKIDNFNKVIIRSIQWLYLLGTLYYCCALTFAHQGKFESIHVYIMVVFAIAAFVQLTFIEIFLILASVYLYFYFMLPYFLINLDALTIFRINITLMNFIALIFNRMIYRMRISLFIDKKLIIKKNIQLNNLSMRDSMTSLLNHENIYKKLNDEIERTKKTTYPLTIIMLDIDDFKYINDNYGHIAGDKVIKKVSELLVANFRATDIIGRYGGEEFVIIMPKTSLEDSTSLAERIRLTVENCKFENDIAITVSGGIIEFHGESAEELIKKVDEKLYKAKKNGKNRFEI